MAKLLTITQGDITIIPMENGALVNPSNTGMILGRGVSAQITRRAGPFIQQALHMKRSTLRNNRLEPGHTVETEAGQLPVKYLIHASILGAKKVNRRLISNCILSAYDRANQLELNTIAFPALGTMIAGFPLDEFLKVFWKITNEELPSSEHLDQVILCLSNNEDFETCADFLEENFDTLNENIEADFRPDGVVPGML